MPADIHRGRRKGVGKTSRENLLANVRQSERQTVRWGVWNSHLHRSAGLALGPVEGARGEEEIAMRRYQTSHACRVAMSIGKAAPLQA
jgi:hypothetical protein